MTPAPRPDSPRPMLDASPSPATWQGELRRDEPLAGHTSWKVGGPARRFYRPVNSEDLARFLAVVAADEPVLWLGLGSNTLVRDGGFSGTVIATHRGLNTVRELSPGELWIEAGVPCARIARLCAEAGVADAEFFAGIPGTFGGALAMNAGAYGRETWRFVQTARMIDRDGRVVDHPATAFSIGYRRVSGPGAWFLGARLSFAGRAEPAALKARMRELLERRRTSQPIGEPSGGSVFRNPEGDHAGRLIEAAGLKGARIGGAAVSTKHANFIVNLGGARAADIEQLIQRIQVEVDVRFGICLEPEVRIVGEDTFL